MERLDVRTVARGRWPGILSAMGLDERTLSGKHAPCPMCGGKDRFRFDDKDGRGTYFCSGCGAGDGVKLAIGCTGQGFREVAQRIEQLAGIVATSSSRAERTDDEKLAALRRVWGEASRISEGDEAHRYLRGRGLALYDLPENVRTHPGLRYQHEGTIATYPAMVALVTGSDGKARSIHRTYLQSAQKAPVEAPKKLMQGLPLAGAAIRLTPVSQVLGIAEGIETALAASELFGVPTWSCISAAGIESFEPPSGAREIVVFSDSDENFAGQKSAYAAAHRLKLKGFSVEVCIPLATGDWLDELARSQKERPEKALLAAATNPPQVAPPQES